MACVMCQGIGRGTMVGVVAYIMTRMMVCVTCLGMVLGTIVGVMERIMERGNGTRHVSWHRSWHTSRGLAQVMTPC